VTDICTCGHERDEHVKAKYNSKMILSAGTCSGHVLAYPKDAERDSEAREVFCHCTSFMEADPEQLKDWGIKAE